MIQIREYLTTKIQNNDFFDDNDPITWSVGDILCGVFCYTMTLPCFYKIIARTPKMFTLRKLKGKIVNGSRNGHWKEIASDEFDPHYKEIRCKLNKGGHLVVDGVTLSHWDGSPLMGDDWD